MGGVNWTGFYFGADITRDYATAFYKRPFDATLSDVSLAKMGSSTGVGGYVGYNYQISPWAVVGVEASANWLGSNLVEHGASIDFLQYVDRMYAVTGRFGVLAGPDTLVYAKAGPAWLGVSGVQGFGEGFSTTLEGVQAGLGIETMVSSNVALRAEASYTTATRTLVLNSGSDRYVPSILMLQFGAEYRFDAPAGWGARSTVESVPPPAWTGFEVGGFLALNGDQGLYSDKNLGDSGPYGRLAVGLGAFVGANYQFAPRYVVGAEVSGNYDHVVLANAAGQNGYLGVVYDYGTVESVWAATGRVGWLATPSSLIYVKGGAAWIVTSTNFPYWNNVAPNHTGQKTLPGYQVGLGVETFVTRNISVRGEGLYTEATGKTILDGNIVAKQFAIRPSVLTATASVAVHF